MQSADVWRSARAQRAPLLLMYVCGPVGLMSVVCSTCGGARTRMMFAGHVSAFRLTLL